MNYGVFGLHVFVRFIPLAALLHSPSAREITLDLTILKGGAAPSFSEKSNVIGDQFSFIFIFKPKLGNPKIYCLGFLGASFSVIFFPRPYFDTRLRLGNHS